MGDGWVHKGLRVSGKHQLIEVLRVWLNESDQPTIGHTRQYHGTFWFTADINGHRVKLTADITRTAVAQVVHHFSARPNAPWRVVANQRGRFNKLIITDRVEPGWYAYLHHPLEVESTI